MTKKFKSLGRKLATVAIAAFMLFGYSASTISSFGFGKGHSHTHAAAEETNPVIVGDGNRTDYVVIGDSMTNGYGLEDYDDAVLGYNSLADGSYAKLFADYLEALDDDATVTVHPLAISGMRAQDLHYMLNDAYTADEYTAKILKSGVTREDYKKAIKGAEYISVQIGANNFGNALADQLVNTLAGNGYEYDLANVFGERIATAVEPYRATLVNKAKQVLSEYGYGANVLGHDLIDVANEIADVFIYNYAGFLVDYTASMQLIRAINPKAQIINLSIINNFSNLSVSVKGYTLPVGKLYDVIIEAANLFMAAFDVVACYNDATGSIVNPAIYVDVSNVDVDTIINEIADLKEYDENNVIDQKMVKSVATNAKKVVGRLTDGTSRTSKIVIEWDDVATDVKNAIDDIDLEDPDFAEVEKVIADIALEKVVTAIENNVLVDLTKASYINDAFDGSLGVEISISNNFATEIENIIKPKIREAVIDKIKEEIEEEVRNDAENFGLSEQELNDLIDEAFTEKQAEIEEKIEEAYEEIEAKINSLLDVNVTDYGIEATLVKEIYNGFRTAIINAADNRNLGGSGSLMNMNPTAMQNDIMDIIMGSVMNGDDVTVEIVDGKFVFTEGSISKKIANYLNSNRAIDSGIYVFARYIMADALGNHPTADGHKQIYNEMVYAFENKLTTTDYVKTFTGKTLEKLEGWIKTYGPIIYEKVYNYADEKGWIDAAKQKANELATKLKAELKDLKAKLVIIKNELKTALKGYYAQFKAEVESAIKLLEQKIAELEKAIDYLKEVIAEKAELTVEIIKDLVAKVKLVAAEVEAAYNKLVETVKIVGKKFADKVLAKIESAVAKVKACAEKLYELAVDAIEDAIEFIDGAVAEAKATAKELAAKLKAKIEELKALLAEAKQELAERLEAAYDALSDKARDAIEALKAKIAELEKAIKELEKELLAVVNAITERTTAALEALANKVNALIEELEAAYSNVVNILTELGLQVESVLGKASELINKVISTAKEAYATTIKVIEAVNNAIDSAINAVANLKAELKAQIDTLKAQIKALKAELETKADALYDLIRAKIAALEQQLAKLEAILEEISNFIKDSANATIANINALINKAQQVLGEIVNVAAQLEAAFEYVYDILAAFGDEVNEVLGNFGKAIFAIVSSIDNLYAYALEAFEIVKDLAKEVGQTIDSVKDAIENIKEELKSTLAKLEAELKNVKDALKAIKAELESKTGEAYEALTKVIAELEAKIAELEAKIAEIKNVIASGAELTLEIIKDFVSEISEIVEQLKAIAETVVEIYEDLVDLLMSLGVPVDEVLSSIKAAVNAIYTSVQNIYDITVDAFNNILSLIKNIEASLESVKATINAIKAELEATLTKLKAELYELKAELAAIKAELLNSVGAYYNTILQKIAELEAKIAKLEAQIEEVLKAIVNRTLNTIEDVKAFIAEINAAIAKIKEIVEEVIDAYNKIVEALAKYGIDVNEMFEGLGNAICNIVSSIDNAYEFILDVVDAAKNVINTLKVVKDKLVEFKAQLAEKLGELEAKLAEIKTQLAEAKKALKNAIGEYYDAIKEAIAILEAKIATLEAKIAEIRNSLEDFATNTIEQVKAFIAKVNATIAEIKQIIEDVIDAYNTLVNILEQLGVFVDKALVNLTNAINNIKYCVENIYNFIVDAYNTIEKIINGVECAYESIKAAIKSAEAYIECIVNVAETVGVIVEYVYNNYDVIVENVNGAIANVENAIINFENAIKEAYNNAITGDYTLTNDSYYVALGDESVLGTAEVDSYAVLLAEKLGLSEKFAQLGLKDIRVEDLLYILDETYEADDYTQALALDKYRTDYVNEIASADLITVGFSANSFTSYLQAQLMKAAMTDTATTTNMDWEKLLGEDLAVYAEIAVEELKAYLLEANVSLSLPNSEQIICTLAESFIYSIVSYAVNYATLVNQIHEINPTAEVVIVGMYNPFAGVVIEGTDLGEYFEYVVQLNDAYLFAYALTIPNTTFVAAGEVEIEAGDSENEAMALILSILGDILPTADGYKAISDNIYNALNISGHVCDWSDWTVINQATCTQAGEETRYCLICGEVETAIIPIDANAHNMVAGTPVPPTCTEDGYTIYTCSYGCGHSERRDVITTSGHSYKDEWTYDDTKHWHECENCDDARSDETNHVFNNWQVTTPATCEENGVETATCVCGKTSEREILATGHSYGAYVETDAPTCVAEGEEARTCIHCDHVDTRAIPIDPNAHNMVAGTPVSPTCTEGGYTTYTCSNGCGHTEKKDLVSALGHEYSNWTVVNEPTCTEAGEKIRECFNCDDVEREVLEATGHDFKDEWATDDEKHWHECEVCDAVDNEAEHTFGDWTVIKEATENEAGLKEKSCTVCGHTIEETIPELGSNIGPGPGPGPGDKEEVSAGAAAGIILGSIVGVGALAIWAYWYFSNRRRPRRR